MSPDLIAGALGLLFSVLIFSYLLGDNPLFRVTVYMFVGISAGYVAAVAWWQVLWPDLLRPLASGSASQPALLAVPLVLAMLLLMKVSPRLTQLGSPSMGFLVGVSAAVAIGGAVIGTILPQTLATINAFDLPAAAARSLPTFGALFNGALILAGAVTTLVYFHYGARTTAEGSIKRFALIEIVAWVGRIFIAITLGVLFAGLYSAALTALIERLNSIVTFFGSF